VNLSKLLQNIYYLIYSLIIICKYSIVLFLNFESLVSLLKMMNSILYKHCIIDDLLMNKRMLNDLFLIVQSINCGLK
jgi:hypothetical protein